MWRMSNPVFIKIYSCYILKRCDIMELVSSRESAYIIDVLSDYLIVYTYNMDIERSVSIILTSYRR